MAVLHVQWNTGCTWQYMQRGSATTCAAEQHCIWPAYYAVGQHYMCSGTPLHMAALHMQQGSATYGICSGTMLHMACAVEQCCIWHVQQNNTAYGSITYAAEYRYMCSRVWQRYMCSGAPLHMAALHEYCTPQSYTLLWSTT